MASSYSRTRYVIWAIDWERERFCGAGGIGLGEFAGRVGAIKSGGDFRGGQFENETGADWGVVFDAEQAVVFADDARRDGEAEAGAAIFGGKVREEKFVFVG